MRNQPITGVRAEDGSRAGQEASKRRTEEREAGGGAEAPLPKRKEEAREKSWHCRRSAGGEAVGGRGAERERGGVGDDSAILSRVSRNPPGCPGTWVPPKAEEDEEEVTHERMSSRLTQQDFCCNSESKERGGKRIRLLKQSARRLPQGKARTSSAFDRTQACRGGERESTLSLFT